MRGGTAGQLAAVAIAATCALACAPPALASPGDIYVVDRNAGPGGSGAVFRIDPTTGAQQQVSAGGELVDPTSISVDSNHSLLVADPAAAGGGGAIISIDPASRNQTVLASGGSLVDPTGVSETSGGCYFEFADPNAMASPGWGDGNFFLFDECGQRTA